MYLWISLTLEFWLQFCEKSAALIYMDVDDLLATPGDTYFGVLTNTVISNQQHLKNGHGLETICDLTANFSVWRSTMANWTAWFMKCYLSGTRGLNTKSVSGKFIYFNFFVTILHVHFYTFALSPCMVYFKLSILFSLHLKTDDMEFSKHCVKLFSFVFIAQERCYQLKCVYTYMFLML